MSDDEIRSRNDMLAPAIPPPSLPPRERVVRDAVYMVRDVAILGMGLAAAKWGFISGETLAGLFFGVVGVNAALRTGQGVSPEAIQALLRR